MERTFDRQPPRRHDNRPSNNTDRRVRRPDQQHDAPAPRRQDAQLVYGLRPVIEALGSGRQVERVLVQSGLTGSLLAELRAAIQASGAPVQYVPVEKLNKLTAGNHQGVVAILSLVQYQSALDLLPRLLDEGRTPLMVLLDHITDVRNMGAIARTAECAGADAIIVPDRGSAALNEDAVKTSSGALLRLPVCREANFKTLLNLARQLGVQLVAATEKGSVPYRQVDFRRPTILVMGNEETGISPEVLRLCDVRAALPIRGEVQSLNVSVAAGIFLYEALAQRG